MKNGDFPVRKLLVYQRVNQSTHQSSCSNDIPISSVSSTKISSVKKGEKIPMVSRLSSFLNLFFNKTSPNFIKTTPDSLFLEIPDWSI
jgi:hypothetical protein